MQWPGRPWGTHPIGLARKGPRAAHPCMTREQLLRSAGVLNCNVNYRCLLWRPHSCAPWLPSLQLWQEPDRPGHQQRRYLHHQVCDRDCRGKEPLTGCRCLAVACVHWKECTRGVRAPHAGSHVSWLECGGCAPFPDPRHGTCRCVVACGAGAYAACARTVVGEQRAKCRCRRGLSQWYCPLAVTPRVVPSGLLAGGGHPRWPRPQVSSWAIFRWR